MGPKKGTSARGGPKNQQSKAPAPPDEGSYIVFSNAKDKPKSQKTDQGNPKKTAPKDGAPEAADVPKRPDTRTLIGGSSWTGKLPVNMLSEHCQKQKWEKPEYTMTKTKAGFVSSVILKQTNTKTKELTVLPPMKPPPSLYEAAAQATAVEARHFAAAYTLFRVCSMRNLHMMLPPTYRDLWKGGFAQAKKDDVVNGNGWMYEADPFLAKQERDSAVAEQAKKRAQGEKEKAKTKEGPKAPSIPGANGNQSGNTSRGWQHVPKVDMGSKIRRRIEDLLREHAIWNPHNVDIPQPQKRAIIDEFTNLGFRRSHVEEAVAECKDREEVLEWLLIYVPEDDLPSWSLPEGYSAGITLASSDLAKEAKIKRLAAAGYPVDLCAEILESLRGDERATAELLQSRLVHHIDGPHYGEDSAHGSDIWEEEQSTLEAIFGARYSQSSSFTCRIQGEESVVSRPLNFTFHKPTGPYPQVPPVLSIIADRIPAYIRLSATRQAIQFAEENFTGEPMIFSIIDWLENSLPAILENPGRLRDISIANNPSVSGRAASQISNKMVRRPPQPIHWQNASSASAALREQWEQKQTLPAQQKMMAARRSLPAWSMQEAIVAAVNSYQVTIISGETGSGKSTQSVQFVLDDMIKRSLGSAANILCTQPRRISALGLADRVSDERCSSVGDEIGYIIRGESKVKRGQTKITFMTTGVLLRRLQSGQENGNNVASSLADVTHVVVDEVHERSLDTDFLLALLREALRHRKDLKVILMSATLDADIFTRYFGGNGRVGRVNIAGRTFPVEDLYLDDILQETGFNPTAFQSELDDDSPARSEPAEQSVGKVVQRLGMGINYELIAATVRYIDSQLGDQRGGILIFLPGTLEIDRCLAALRTIPNTHPLPLHASLQSAEQRRVFQRPPAGKRKVIAATNVAETSITIDDIVAVIDTGRVKETSYDPKDNMVRLAEIWASQAACKQRRGRAGRVQAGTCYKLYTRKAESNMLPRPDPEIRRVPLEQLCLSVKSMRGINDVAKFLAETLTPPESLAVEGALELLNRMGALDSQQLTALGRYMSMIPADLRCAKLMVFGSVFGCLDACVTIAAILTVRSPFISPKDKRDEAKEARSVFSRGDGDLLVDLNAYQQWSEKMKSQGFRQAQLWCNANFLNHQTLRDISSNKAQFLSSLKDAGILPIKYRESDEAVETSRWNRYNGNTQLLRALVAGAFNPQTARISFPDKKFAASSTGTVELDPEARTIKYFSQENGRVFVHPSSILFETQSFSGSASFVSYFTKMATSKVFIRDLTPFNAFGLLLFSGPISLDTLGRGLVVDGWLRLRGWARIGVLVSRLRLMLDDALARKMDNPDLDTAEEDEVTKIVRRLVELNGLDQ